MSYLEKLEAIEAELVAQEDEDLDGEAVDQIRAEYEKELYDEALENFQNNYQPDYDEAEFFSYVREQLQERMLQKRLTPEEQKERGVVDALERVDRAEGALKAAEARLKKNEADLAFARERNKPKMIAHEESLRHSRQHDVERAQTDLSKARIALNEAKNEETLA